MISGQRPGHRVCLAAVPGTLFTMAFEFKSETHDSPVLRALWKKLDSGWRIIAYGIEMP
jgi:hypothetical protein